MHINFIAGVFKDKVYEMMSADEFSIAMIVLLRYVKRSIRKKRNQGSLTSRINIITHKQDIEVSFVALSIQFSNYSNINRYYFVAD